MSKKYSSKVTSSVIFFFSTPEGISIFLNDDLFFEGVFGFLICLFEGVLGVLL